MRTFAQTILAPRSVAVIGASDDRNRVGGRPIHYMRRFGFEGRIFPVNPRRDVVQGLPCYAAVADLPEAPDVAVVAVGAEGVADAVRACGKRGTRVAVVMTSGFAEMGAEGRRREADLAAVASGCGVRLVGPNCQGIANFRTGAIANFSTMFMEVAPQDGPIALVSQSGAASVVPYAMLRERGIGVRYVVASGNDRDVTAVELLDAAIDDPEIRVALLYVETIGDPDALAAAAAKARARDVAIVAIKGGSSAKGAAAAASHTGALATEDAVVEAFFERHGIWRVRTMADLVAAVPLHLSGRPTGGGRLLVMSHSGAVGVLCADIAERLGLPMPDLAPDTRECLAAVMPAFGGMQNPVDLTAALMTQGGMFAQALGVLVQDPAVDVVQLGFPVGGEGYDVEAFARSAASIARDAGKPLVVSGPQRAVLQTFERHGLPTFQDDAAALAALAQYVGHRRLAGAEPVVRAGAVAPASLPPGRSALSEAASLSILRRAGIPVVEHAVCATLDQAQSAFDKIAGPCVVKACSADAPHKSEHGLVLLNVTTQEALAVAYSACRERMEILGLTGEVIVARMERGLRELAVGGRRDPVFGPVVLVGDGGKYVEVMRDHRLLVPPFSAADAVAALRRLRVWPILRGVRGEPAADVASVGAIAVRVGDLLAATPAIEAVDLNPVIVRSAGSGSVVVDALITRMPESMEAH